MELLIDGYNLCKQLAGSTFLSPIQLASYIKTLARYMRVKELQALLVFDGGMQERAAYEEYDLLKVIYVGKNKTADDFIKVFLQEYHGKDILLVSSDRELNRVADYYNAPSIDIFDFWHFVKRALIEKKPLFKKSGHSIKTSSSTNQELDALMSALKVTGIKQDDMITEGNTAAFLKHSKIEKKLLQKIKKL